MNESQRLKWNSRYQGATLSAAQPAEVVAQYLHLLPTQGYALDLACGLGGNALLLAEQGLSVDAWDISEVALALLQGEAERRQLTITTAACDLLAVPLPLQRYDVIVVSRFLERTLAAPIIAALKPGGLLFYQTWTVEKLDSSGPGNPHYLLQPNELLQLFAPLRIVVYREEGDIGNLQSGLRSEALLIAQRKP